MASDENGQGKALGIIALVLLAFTLVVMALVAVGAMRTPAPAGVSTAQGGAPAEVAAPAVAMLFSAAQAARGEEAYAASCTFCHGAQLTEAPVGPPLAGPMFAETWAGRPVGELYAYAHDNMPPGQGGSLPETTYADIVAYILSVNGMAAGDADLPPDPALADPIEVELAAAPAEAPAQ